MTQSFSLEQFSVYFVHLCTNFAPFNVCKSEKLQETVGPVGALVLERHTVFHGLQRFASCLAFVDDRLK